MPQAIKVYVPAYRDESDRVTGIVERILTRKYGGATTYRDQCGVWETPDEEIDRNPVHVVESIAVQQPVDEDNLSAILDYIRHELDQEEIIATVSDVDLFRSTSESISASKVM